MARVRLSIEPHLCGPISVGTVAVVRLARERLGLSLSEALAHVNRCVFEGETVWIDAPSMEAAESFVRAVTALETPARIDARVSV
jgi:hypothetical protein